MKVIISIMLIAVLSYLCGLLLPWWTIAVVAFVVAYFMKLRPIQAFASGFVAIFLLWFILSFTMSAANEHALATSMAGVIFKGSSPYLLIIVSALTGGIVAGLAAITAAYLNPVQFNKTAI